MAGEYRRELLANAGSDQRGPSQEDVQFVDADFNDVKVGDHIIMRENGDAEGGGVTQRGTVSSRTQDTITVGTITGHRGDAPPKEHNGYAPSDIGHVGIKRERE